MQVLAKIIIFNKVTSFACRKQKWFWISLAVTCLRTKKLGEVKQVYVFDFRNHAFNVM